MFAGLLYTVLVSHSALLPVIIYRPLISLVESGHAFILKIDLDFLVPPVSVYVQRRRSRMTRTS